MPKCILIVEDHKIIRQLIRRHLEAQPGFEVCGEAVDGVDAIEQAERLKPDLIVLDLQLPRMSGLEAAKILRRMDHQVLIVMFTMHADILLAQKSHNGDINAVVSKLDGVEVLFSEIQRLTEEHGPSEHL